MTASGVIAEPNRSVPVAPSGYWRGRGGQGGTIATPSRGSGAATAPPAPRGGAIGPISTGRPVLSRNEPFALFDSITGLHVTHYVRKWTPNFAGITRFLTSSLSNTDWSTNSRTMSNSSGDPIRVDSRFEVQTYREMFDTRIQTLYTPQQAVQRGNFLTVSSAGSNNRMVTPYFNRMTMYRANPPYAAQTETLG